MALFSLIASGEKRGLLGTFKVANDHFFHLRLDLKPENLLYLTKDPTSDLVLADFGIAKMLDTKDEVLTTMAGSFGYAAPEIMLKQGHGKAVDMWSLGVITYTLLCGYSPFRSENLTDLIEECRAGRIIFHERFFGIFLHCVFEECALSLVLIVLFRRMLFGSRLRYANGVSISRVRI